MELYLPVVLLLAVLRSGVGGSDKHLNKQEWEELENLFEQVDEVGDRIISHDTEDDGSNILLRATQADDDNTITSSKETTAAKNPCEKRICGWGKECMIVDKKDKCDCARQCPHVPFSNQNDRVCSNRNQTFDSICHLYRERCLCKKNDPSCSDLFNNKQLHLEYLGACKELQPCTHDHLEQFSVRMADWLFQVMKDLKKRQDLHGEKWIQMLEEAEYDEHLKHVYPVIWKYCDLDREPHDKSVTHHELIPIIAPVMPMESCIKPFLKSCDADKNNLISLKEWGKCLGLREEEITERC